MAAQQPSNDKPSMPHPLPGIKVTNPVHLGRAEPTVETVKNDHLPLNTRRW
jgi:hypothetical protein